MKLSIILVNYNGLKHLPACLDSIRRFAPSGTEVIMVDNASTDGSAEWVSGQFPWVRLIQSDRNLGYSGGNNLGAQQAAGEYFLLLNTDTILLEPLLPAVQWLEVHPAYGALTITMLDADLVPRACTGYFPGLYSLVPKRRMLIAPETYGAFDSQDVDWVQGSFLLTRKDVWQQLKGLDERYFMYGEDVDFCKRVKDSGKRCALLPTMQYVHSGGFTITRIPQVTAGICRYVNTHVKGPRKTVLWMILLITGAAGVVAYQIRSTLIRNKHSRDEVRARWLAFWQLISLMRPANIASWEQR